MKELITALIEAQGDFSRVLKGEDNPYFKSKYADLSTVVDAIMPSMRKHGLTVIQRFDIRDGRHGMVTMLCHTSGQVIEGFQELKPIKDDPQAMASCSTYARRYGLMAIAGVAPEDDDGNGASKKQEQKKPAGKNADDDIPFDNPLPNDPRERSMLAFGKQKCDEGCIFKGRTISELSLEELRLYCKYLSETPLFAQHMEAVFEYGQYKFPKQTKGESK